MPEQILFLSWDSPWPPQTGSTLRHFGILKEISKYFEIDLVILSRQPLSNEQTEMLLNYAKIIIRIPLRDVSFLDKLQVLRLIIMSRYPYHSATLISSLRKYPDVLNRIKNFPGVVYASGGQWGTLVIDQDSPNWILDQQNADVHFWKVYATQVTNCLLKLVSLMNWKLSNRHFSRIYPKVGKIVSVCEEDRQITLSLAPQSQVCVIENGVDCSYYKPDLSSRTGSRQLLFTGTSAMRNMKALHQFVRNIFPLVLRKFPDVELVVGGNFSIKAQAEFSKLQNIHFTGKINDMRPIFNQSDIYVAPFEDTHGSKLKIAEAMAMGMPIVSTPNGIRGFPLVNGESVLIAHNNKQFVAYINDLLINTPLCERLGTKARKIALSTIDWQILGHRIVGVINSIFN